MLIERRSRNGSLKRRQERQWVRGWRARHPLPVVAIGSIPYIYRRVGFRLRATPARDGIPHRGLRFWTE